MKISIREFHRNSDRYLKNLKEKITLTKYNLPVAYLTPIGFKEDERKSLPSVKPLNETKFVPDD